MDHLSVGVEVAATVSHNLDVVVWVPDLFAKRFDLLLELGLFFRQWSELGLAGAHQGSNPDLDDHNKKRDYKCGEEEVLLTCGQQENCCLEQHHLLEQLINKEPDELRFYELTASCHGKTVAHIVPHFDEPQRDQDYK